MISHELQHALERKVVGQRRAVEAVVRAVTLTMSGLGTRDAPAGVYLFVGPTGTGKTHLARSLAELIQPDGDRLALLDCSRTGACEDWPSVIGQLAPYFRFVGPEADRPVLRMAPLTILVAENVEAARPEFLRALVGTVRSGSLPLPEGKRGSFDGCLVLLASKLCSREVFEAERTEIGFQTATEDLDQSEKARIYRLCCAAVEKQWGGDFLGQLDDLIVFHRLREAHLPLILDRLIDELNGKLSARGVACEVAQTARDFILARGARFLHHGALSLEKLFRRYVQFPVADLFHGGRIPPGSRVVAELEADERLRFTVEAATAMSPEAPRRVEVEWTVSRRCGERR